MINILESKAAGLNKQQREELKKIQAGLSRYGKRASALGVQIFGGSVTNTFTPIPSTTVDAIVSQIKASLTQSKLL